MRAQSFAATKCVVVLILIMGSTSRAVPSAGLVAYYPFNGNANDASSNGHDGVVHGTSLTVDRFGNPNSAYSFDGVNDYISVAYASAMQLPAYTLAAWILPSRDLSPGSGGAVIGARGEDFSTDRLWSSLEIVGQNNPQGTGATLLYEDSGDNERVYGTAVFPAPNVWTHIAATRSLTGEVFVYINGSVVGQWSSTPAPATTCTQELTIGARWWSSSTSGPYQLVGFFPGSIDEVVLYNRALLPEEFTEVAVIPAPGAGLLVAIGLGVLHGGRRLGRRVSN